VSPAARRPERPGRDHPIFGDLLEDAHAELLFQLADLSVDPGLGDGVGELARRAGVVPRLGDPVEAFELVQLDHSFMVCDPIKMNNWN
jgi:hypothetical protein